MKRLTEKEAEVMVRILETMHEVIASNDDGMYAGHDVYKNQKAVCKAIANINKKVLGFENDNLKW